MTWSDSFFDPFTFNALGDWSHIEHEAYPITAPDQETKDLADKALAALTPAQRDVIELLYGFRGDIKSLTEVAAVRHVSRQSIHEVHQTALLKMRRALGRAEDGQPIITELESIPS